MPTAPPPVYDGVFEVPDEPVVCEDPVEGWDRFVDEGAERGLVIDQPPGGGDGPQQFGSGLAGMRLAAQDVDGDGDIDLVAAEGAPILYLNDGTGHFTHPQGPPGMGQGNLLAVSVADLDGDGLAELLGGARSFDDEGESTFAVWPGLGDGRFDTPDVIGTGLSGRSAEPCSIPLGDIDGDGDLDLHFCTRNSLPEAGGGYPDRVFLYDDGYASDRYVDLVAYDGWGVTSLVSTFSDYDLDGDQDLFVIGGEPTYGFPEHPGSAMYRNDGGSMPNVADSIGLGASFSAMGVDSADLNQDGRFDYVMTDVGPPRLFLSDGSGGWFEGGPAAGLAPDRWLIRDSQEWDDLATIGWSIDLQDLDNDGLQDVLQASAPDHGGIWGGVDEFPDLLWAGAADGTFRDVTAQASFGSADDHVGMVSADFDGNGWVDVFFHAEFFDRPLILLMNRCGSHHWLTVDLDGPPENREGFGARVAFRYGDRTELREVYSLRATAQNPTEIHQGLGTQAWADEVIVTWPDGVISRAENVPADRKVVVVHPRSPRAG